MIYKNTLKGVFVDRPNRFIANVKIGGKIETVHVKNTGRCKELLIPGTTVILEEFCNTNRKTKYDLIAVYKDGLGLVNMDSQAPNKVVLEWLKSNQEIFKNITYIKPEYSFGKSRIDFYLEYSGKKVLLEVKGCTLEINGIGYFPDAPTERGIKHLEELSNAVEQGFECYICYVISMPDVVTVLPNETTHPEYAKAFYKAVKKGVKPLYLPCEVTENSLIIK